MEQKICKTSMPLVAEKTDYNDLEEISRYCRRKMEQDEIYTFSVILCDNDLDRDHERFTREALDKLSILFPGKTGIFDHETKSSNQAARLYQCEVIEDGTRNIRVGEPYAFLKGKAYMVRNKKNEDLILEIDAGIKKEVSISCAVEKVICSVCGGDIRSCGHIRGKVYQDQMCYAEIMEPTDAYEWSFVAVPAQPSAGVVKGFGRNSVQSELKRGEKEMISSLKEKSMCEKLVMEPEEFTLLLKEIAELEEKSALGENYLAEMRREVLRLGALVQPELARTVLQGICLKLTLSELQALKKSYEQKADRLLPPVSVLGRKEAADNYGNEGFRI